MQQLWSVTIFLLAACTTTALGDIRSFTGRATVVDGDTLRVEGTKVRLEGIDAPESKQLCFRQGKRWGCGREAAYALADMVAGAKVTCYSGKRDRYKRHLATCEARGVNLNQWMVRQGFAVAYKSSTAYLPSEAMARSLNRGLWGAEFRLPWEWRKDKKK